MPDWRSIPELIAESARLYGASTCTCEARDGGRSLSYVELDESMRRGAGLLRALNSQSGQTALLLVEPRADWLAACAAILQAGWIAVPLPHDTPAEFVAAIAQGAACRAAIVGDASDAGLAARGELRRIHVNELLAAPRPSADLPRLDRSDLALLAFTSGSTQRPKAVELTHGNLLSNLSALLQIRQGSPRDAMLSMLPPAHLFALVAGTLAPLACGAKIVYPSSLLPNRIVDTLRDHGITHALAVPALAECLYREVLEQLIESGWAAADQRTRPPAEVWSTLSCATADELTALRNAVRDRIGAHFASLVIGGAAVDPDLVQVISALGVRVDLGYGLTEAGPIVAVGTVGQCPRRSVGRPIPGVEVQVDPQGEILVRSGGVMRGYHRDPAATAETIVDGWLRTGDSGQFDDQGNLFIHGRLKEALVNSAGRTLYPDDIEPYFASSLFAEHCVSGLQDADGNDIPLLFAVPHPNVASDDLAREFEALQDAAPASYRVSRLVVLDAPLPRTPSGKVRRRAVAQAFVALTQRQVNRPST